MFCYCVRNKINSKLYIGITNRSINIRWKQHIQRMSDNVNNRFHNAINKYGLENFEINYIDYTGQCDYEELKEIEAHFIKKYDTYNNGYNSTKGGDGTIGNGKRVCQYLKNGKFVFKYNSILEATKKTSIPSQSISFCCLKRSKYKSAGGFLWAYDGDIPNKYINNSGKNTRGKVLKLNKQTNELIQIYNSIKEAEQLTGIANQCISYCCNGKRRSAGGFIWKFKEEKI